MTEGIRKLFFDKVNRKAESIRKKDVTCYVLFALVKNGNKVKRAAGERGKKPAVSRTAACRRCLSCINLSSESRSIFSVKKCYETEM